ncbi:MAG: hypothetical protein HGB17_04615 [Syntrophobacteraceae bacterium]|nr:hypothetical protein [Syntrophobacteraceae bacterium]
MTVESVEREVQTRSPPELAAFREWFANFDAATWERQIEDDARSGKLDTMADAALAKLEAGKCTEL